MKWFLNISTRTKLLVAFGLVVLLLAAVSFTAYWSVTETVEAQKKMHHGEFNNTLNLNSLRSHQFAARSALLAMMIASGRSAQDQWHQEIKDRRGKIDDVFHKLIEANRNNPDLLARLEQWRSLWTAFRQTRDAQIIPLIYQGKAEEARRLILQAQTERIHEAEAIINELVSQAVNAAATAVLRSERRATQSILAFAGVGVIALVIAVGMAAVLNRVIANPLKEISTAAERVSGGDLTLNVSSDSRADEVGYLTQTFRKMIENLREVNRQIREGVNVLGSSASEIVAATTQVASGAAETATAVTETTTTVEEVKQTAQVSSQKAKSVSESAQKSAQVSQLGRKSVDDTVEGMNRIRQQMESIAESIVKLSEQSQVIGEIIATVNDLADQSNLLAVNAAIEAAKAGEAGKGFAVVAQEIKSLAEQSKQATAQVRSILTDIQKATSAAVMATEQGSKAVEAGVRQSTEAGTAIRALADSIAEAAQAATQIAASSQQQSVGMDQVAMAMENIKQASSQNVASTRQAEAAAQSLHELGQKLKLLVEQYKV